MKGEHTPGPWTYRYTALQDGKGGETEYSVVHYRNEVPYSETKDEYICRKVSNEANARLIAAAPGLLAACKKLAEWDKSHDDVELISEACSMARSAIAKAKGG